MCFIIAIPNISLRALSFLVRELRLPDLVSSQDDVEDTFHSSEKFLIWSCGASFEVRNDSRSAVALGREILLGHGLALIILCLSACSLDRVCNLGSDRLRFDDVIASIDFGQMLASGVVFGLEMAC